MTNLPQLNILVLKGDKVNALYSNNQLPIYQGNPLIEALPPILTDDEAAIALSRFPKYQEQDRNLPAHERLHLTTEVLHFFQPWSIHIDLFGRFSRLIRNGYRSRNPIHIEYRQDLNVRLEALRLRQPFEKLPRSSITGFTVIGVSGMGKSTTIEETLLCYPQVINHGYYNNQDFILQQVVWLKLDCPADGSLKGMCLNFFQGIDDLLGTHYYERFSGGGRRSAREMIPDMARIASLHSLGVLVIDEVQALSHLRSGGHNEMLNFFVQLRNTIGLPVVLVGTPKAQIILGGDFRQMRRATGLGDMVWDRMENDDVWQFFIESLWHYQYVRIPSPLTPKLADVLYEETQGIVDFAVKLYMLAQVRAIASSVEKITTSIIKSAAKDDLKLPAPVLSALKAKNWMKLAEYEDVFLSNIDSSIDEAKRKLTSSSLSIPTTKTQTSQAAQVTESQLSSQNSSVDSAVNITTTPKNSYAPSPKTKKNLPKDMPSPSGGETLLQVINLAAQKGIPAYEALKNAGYIFSAIEYHGGSL